MSEKKKAEQRKKIFDALNKSGATEGTVEFFNNTGGVVGEPTDNEKPIDLGFPPLQDPNPLKLGGALLPYKMGNRNEFSQRQYDYARLKNKVGGKNFYAMSNSEEDAAMAKMKRGDFKYNALSKARQKFFGRGSQGSGGGSSSGPLASDRRVGYGSQGSGGDSGKALDSDRNVGYGSQGSGGGSSRGPLDSDRSLGYGTQGRTYSPNRDLIRARKLKRRGAPEAAKALEMRYALGPDAPAVQSVRQRKTLQEDNEAAQRQHQLNLEIMKASMATNLNQNRFDAINFA